VHRGALRCSFRKVLPRRRTTLLGPASGVFTVRQGSQPWSPADRVHPHGKTLITRSSTVVAGVGCSRYADLLQTAAGRLSCTTPSNDRRLQQNLVVVVAAANHRKMRQVSPDRPPLSRAPQPGTTSSPLTRQRAGPAGGRSIPSPNLTPRRPAPPREPRSGRRTLSQAPIPGRPGHHPDPDRAQGGSLLDARHHQEIRDITIVQSVQVHQ
jgi:hypothetical protein